MQGEDKATIKLGLYVTSPKTKKHILVSVMTFCKPRKALGQKSSSIYDYELSRFASTYNYVILNGFSRLFDYFIANYTWSRILTYADKRWSDGDVYTKNGWTHDHDSKPNYWYTDGHKRFHRYIFNKQNLKQYATHPNNKYYERFKNIYNEALSEKEIMQRSKLYTIYDCGNMIYTYERTNDICEPISKSEKELRKIVEYGMKQLTSNRE